MVLMPEHEQVLKRIDEQELVELAVAMGNIKAPSGYEQPMADFVLQWLKANGFDNSYQQEVAEGRSNTIGMLRGTGAGKTLIFNSHMDSEQGMPMRLDEEPPPGPAAIVDKEKKRIFGLAVQNDRGPMAAFMIATKAIKNSGIRLAGDILMTMVVGEIGMGPVDEFRGARFIGKGYGSRHAITHGINGDFALIAETTDFGVTWIEAGAAYFKVTIEGKSFYTPRLPERGALKDNPNALIKMITVIQAIEKWAVEYEKKYTTEYPVGKMVPKISIGAIRAGAPYKPSTTPKSCSIYVDVRVPPLVEFIQVERELREVVQAVGLGGIVECFMARKGYEGKNVEPLVEAVCNAHLAVRGSPPPPINTPETSMWRDINIFNEVGIPAATFGMPRKSAPDVVERFVEIKDIVDAAKMYALVALEICGSNR
ncbi:MAG: M20/M25/M40 family metallo-hydrolase [Deltaproteobacteria bacterium]|nr:M20/M25/M40 family metallo-hydrolase [Deltaproteobacteria bacterium]